jgi:hypothetical protein
MFDRVPDELKALPQWVVWRYEQEQDAPKPTKVPYSPRSHYHASVTDQTSWGTFAEAVNRYIAGGYSGIGFVLTANDPFCFIDLDDVEGDALALERQKRVFDAFDSYSELSPSGRGVHIIVKGSVASGRKRAHIEIYSSARYMTMTGNVVKDTPVVERQAYCQLLWEEIGTRYESLYVTGDIEQKEDDRTVYDRACAAQNGAKFLKLWRGEWNTTINERTGLFYNSQSEADFALINILTYHTKTRNQIRNMFLQSGLGQRDKAKRVDYVENMITRAFDMTVPNVDFEGLKNMLEAEIAKNETARTEQAKLEEVRAVAAAVQSASGYINGMDLVVNRDRIEAPIEYGGSYFAAAPELPPGLMGDLARFIFEASPRPVPDIALMGAIGLMAGICGRSWNISGTGLNQYMLLLAKTGRGKEAMSSGIDKLLSSVRQQIPAISGFIGPGDLASGQALIRHLSSVSPSFVSIIGEFDKLLSALSHQKANSAMIMLRKAILDLFGKSGYNQTYRPMIYSDAKKDTQTIISPAFSILGECTPEKFYEMLDEQLITEGLLPRFMVIEYAGDRVPLNRGFINAVPSIDLIKAVTTVTETSMLLTKGVNGQFRVQNIQLAEDAEQLMNEFDQFCDSCINFANRDAVAQLWNRAHLKVLKMAGLVAIGVNPHFPVVTREIAAWAMRFIERDVRNMLSRFDTGEIGSDEAKQINELRKAIAEYVQEPYDKVARYHTSRQLHHAKIVPQKYLSAKLHAVACYRKDKMGATFALKRALNVLLDQSEVIEVNRDQLQQTFGTSSKAYMVKEMRL